VWVPMQRGAASNQLKGPENPGQVDNILTRVISIQKTITHELSDPLNKCCRDGVDLLWIRNATLVFHAHNAIPTAILFQFQMAILQKTVAYEHLLCKRSAPWKYRKYTYMRSTIRIDAAAKAK
jgi:hypothetical protein